MYIIAAWKLRRDWCLFGKSTSIIAGAAEDRGLSERAFAIDPFDCGESKQDKHIHKVTHGLECYFQEFQDLAKGLNYLRNIIPIATYSQNCLPFLLFQAGFAFIDGCHDLDDVNRDFSLVYPKLVPGAIVLFHDAMTDCRAFRSVVYPGVMEAIDQIKSLYPDCTEVGGQGTICGLKCKNK